MKAFFSRRHQEAIAKGTIKGLSFSVKCRTSIDRILKQHSDLGGTYGEENLTFDYMDSKLKTFYGVDKLMAFGENNKRVPATMSEVIISGYPLEVLDIIEAWFDENPKRSRDCEKELNDIFFIHNSPWRVINGLAVLVDSEYLNSEVRAKSIRLLDECEIQGALEEYQDAINDLVSNNTKDAIVNAHKSVESVMKAVLETDKPYTFGKLLEILIQSGIIPEYYNEFLQHFEKIALGVVKERNLPARGHGQGKKPTEVSPSLAEFTVNLAGAINVFIIKHWIEIKELTTSL